MIEIKEGWTAAEIFDQNESRQLALEIGGLNKKLEVALERRAELQLNCKHTHVLFAGQEMTCEVCRARIDK